jgi:anti-sigma regulatory factor (Ser/Thr protein kinase)
MRTPDAMKPELRRELASDVASPAQARTLVRQMLQVWDADGECEVAELLTSELVTNAVRHAATEILLRVEVDDARVRIEVSDTSAEMPRIRAKPDVGGYGLRIVDELATRWGVEAVPDNGKTVWFELDVRARGV